MTSLSWDTICRLLANIDIKDGLQVPVSATGMHGFLGTIGTLKASLGLATLLPGMTSIAVPDAAKRSEQTNISIIGGRPRSL